MREKIRKILYYEPIDGTDEIREHLFRLILYMSFIVCCIAIAAGLALETPLNNALPILALLVTVLIAAVITFRFHRADLAAMFFAVILIGAAFPFVFFLGGGIDSGSTVWFVLGILYIFIMFRGIKLCVFLILAVVADVGTYVVAFQHPELILPLKTKSDIYYDSLFAVLAVGISVGIIVRYQIQSYEKERKRTLEQKYEIEKISKSKDAFFANMSHEIRTPINTIIGLNEMILREEISEEVAEDALKVKNASKILLTLINDILDFSQIESDRMVIVPAAYQTRELFDDVVNMLQVRMSEKNLDFYVNIDSELPAVLLGDEVRIKQVLINLLTNAAKYTHKGSVTLDVQAEPAGEEAERLTITVSDTGIGIKKEDLESLYDYFKRIDRENNRKIEGSGLGLAITKQLISLMGGTITVDSIYRRGSVFTVTLEQPVLDERPVGNVNYLAKSMANERSRYRQLFEAPMAKILVADDNETNLMVISKLLRATKVQIDTAKSGEECLEMVRKKVYHAILLDSMMSGMSGQETLKAIRRQEDAVRRTPVIIVTANALASDKQRYLESGFDGYLAKPVDGVLLEAEILKFLPEALVEYRADTEESGGAAAQRRVLRRKRKKIQISTDCVSDLSKEYVACNDIKMIYSYIETERGMFRDTLEIDSDNLSRHLSRPGSRAAAVSASVEEYEAFYAEALSEAEEVIHIAMASGLGDSYHMAEQAAVGFDHVHVIDAGHISCGEGLLVLLAVRLLQDGCNQVEELCSQLEMLKKQIETAFFMPNIRSYYNSGYADWMPKILSEFTNFHPTMRMRQSEPKLRGFYFGNLEKAKKRFIHKIFRRKNRIDKRVVFIAHASCSVKQQQEFIEEVLKAVPFEKVIVERASVSCSSNGGIGSIGVAFLTLPKGAGVELKI